MGEQHFTIDIEGACAKEIYTDLDSERRSSRCWRFSRARACRQSDAHESQNIDEPLSEPLIVANPDNFQPTHPSEKKESCHDAHFHVCHLAVSNKSHSCKKKIADCVY